MPNQALEVIVPENCIEEMRYVLNVVFEEFWGVQYLLIVAPQDFIIISSEQSLWKVVINADFFLRASKDWLGSDSLPKLPLRSLVVKDYDFLRALDFSELPVLYGSPAVLVNESCIEINFDVFGTIFFMLSRYEEYLPVDRDIHDRMQGKSSVAHKAGFEATPIVNQYLEVLWQVLLHAGFSLKRKLRSFTVEPTCDLDNPFDPAFDSLWFSLKHGARSLLDNRSPAQLVKNTGRYFFGRRFAEDEFAAGADWIMATCEESALRVQFYLIPKITHKKDGYNDPFSSKFIKLVGEASERGHAIGMHPGYLSYDSEVEFGQTVRDFRRLLRSVNLPSHDIHSRMHYLRWKFPETLKLYAKYDIKSDSTMAFADAPAFRSGVCFDYPMYDLSSRAPTSVTQKPLILMESSVLDVPYLALGHSEEAKSLMLNLKEQCRIYDGNFRFLWHNCHLGSQADRHFFKLLIEY